MHLNCFSVDILYSTVVDNEKNVVVKFSFLPADDFRTTYYLIDFFHCRHCSILHFGHDRHLTSGADCKSNILYLQSIEHLIVEYICSLQVFSGEFFRFTLSKSPYNDYETRYELLGVKIPPFLSSAVRINALFAYGALITVSITDITKFSVGRLRPHFLDVCKPDWDKLGQDICPIRYRHETKRNTGYETEYIILK